MLERFINEKEKSVLENGENKETIKPLDENEDDLETQKVNEYWKSRNNAEVSLQKKKLDLDKILKIKSELGIGNSTEDRVNNEIDVLENNLIELQSNCPDNPTLLLKNRLESSEIRNRFMKTRTEYLSSLKDDNHENDIFAKSHQYKSHYIKQMDDYDSNLEKVFNSTEIGEAKEFHKNKENLGRSAGIGHEGTVFIDSEIGGRQKSIIEAHEKGHGIRDFRGDDSIEIRSVLDSGARDIFRSKHPSLERVRSSYLSNPDEIIERMSQLKNYFGFRSGEKFTKKHLDYARSHYIQDTGLDNNMSEFFAGITPDTESHFLEVINKFPI